MYIGSTSLYIEIKLNMYFLNMVYTKLKHFKVGYMRVRPFVHVFFHLVLPLIFK